MAIEEINSNVDNAKKSVTTFEEIAKQDFETRRSKEVELMKKIVYGRTPLNILKSVSQRNVAVNASSTTADGKTNTASAPRRMTAKAFIETVMTIRNLSGQNVMIPDKDIEKMGLELAPYAKPFYDKDNNKFYEISFTKRSPQNNNKNLNFYANKKISQELVDNLYAPSATMQDGHNPDVQSALEICEKLSAHTGVTLMPNDKVNVFMPSNAGRFKRKAKDILSTITLNKWKSKKFVPQSGNLYMNTKGMNSTDILTSYVSNCAMRSFDTNLSTFLNVVRNDREFLNQDAKDKEAQINAYKKDYELIKYKLHNICTDLIASEMCKMLPDTEAEGRLALSEGYQISAVQKMNELGKYLNDPYVMKFISTTVTDSVSRYNANFAFTPQQIVDANCKVCGYKNLFENANRDTALYGEYEVPLNNDFKFSTYPTKEAEKTVQEESEMKMSDVSKTPNVVLGDKEMHDVSNTPKAEEVDSTQDLEKEEKSGESVHIIDTTGTATVSPENVDSVAMDGTQRFVDFGNEVSEDKETPENATKENEFSPLIIPVNEKVKDKVNNKMRGTYLYYPENTPIVKRDSKLADAPIVTRDKEYVIKPAKNVDPIFSKSIKTFGERTPESIEKSITKYVVGLTEKALKEKSLSDKNHAVDKEGLSTLSAERARSISDNQNAVTTLYNSAHTRKTAKQAADVIDKASISNDEMEKIQAKTLNELEKINENEVEKVIQAYNQYKDKYPDWGTAKTPAKFVNFYYKNIVGAETKYGNDLKREIKDACRRMDASIAENVKAKYSGKEMDQGHGL